MKFKFLKHYFCYKDKIYNYFLYRLNFNREKAEDLASETFLKAFKNFQDFSEEKGTFQSWVFTIAHNLLANFYRDQKIEQSIEEIEEETGEIENEDLLKEVVFKTEVRLIIDKIQRLPDNFSQVLILRLVNDLPYKEIAQITNKSEGNVRVVYMRALKRLNKEIKL